MWWTVLDAQVRAAEMALAALKKEVPLNIEATDAARVDADATVLKSEAAEQQARHDNMRYKQLEAKHIIERHKLVEMESILADMTIRAPAGEILITRLVNQGEMVTSGGPLFDLVDLDRLYLKAYVPEILIGKLRLGLPCRIHTDAFPKRAFPATLRYISSIAEFTPKEVQTPDG
jgi:HlyD family secretion protein